MKLIKNLYPYVIIIFVVVMFRLFIATPVIVDGDSMNSTLSDGEILILNKLDKSYDRFDIVVIKDGKDKLIKRIIGLPGENIEYKDNELYINGKVIEDVSIARTGDFSIEELYGTTKIPENHYFVMGDNRGNSKDSRYYKISFVAEKDIVGTTTIRLFPFTKIGKFN